MDKWNIEMMSVRKVKLENRFYQRLDKYHKAVRPALFLIVIMLNLNVLMSSGRVSEPISVLMNGPGRVDDGEDTADVDDEAAGGSSLAVDDDIGKNYDDDYPSAPLSNAERLSLFITFFLGIINFLGYLMVMYHGAATEVPIIVGITDKMIEENSSTEPLAVGNEATDLDIQGEIEQATVRKRLHEEREKKRYNPAAFNLWGVTLALNVLFIVMHRTNFPDQPSYRIYALLIFGINLPWTLSCLRNYIVVPNRRERIFVMVWDVFMRREFMRTHIILLLISAAGFQSNRYFTLMLLDVFSNSSDLMNIANAVRQRLPQVGLVIFVIISTLLIVASFGVDDFEDAFEAKARAYSANDDGIAYDTVLQAFWFLLYNLPDRGNVKKTLGAQKPGDDRYIQRVFVDTFVFLWVGVILFTSITALLVDALNKHRAEQQRISNARANECFVCGLEKQLYNQYGVKPTDNGRPAATWEDHMKDHHNPWQYSAFILHLYMKHDVKRERLTGLESFVFKKIGSKDDMTSWVPFRTSYDLQQQNLGISAATNKKKAAKLSDQSSDQPGGAADNDDDGGGDESALAEIVRDLALKQDRMADEQRKILRMLSELVQNQQHLEVDAS